MRCLSKALERTDNFVSGGLEMSSVLVQNTQGSGLAHGFGPVPGLELLQDMLDVGFYGAL